MIKQYMVTVVYPNHFIPLDKRQFTKILWDGLAVLGKEAVQVTEMGPPAVDAPGYCITHGLRLRCYKCEFEKDPQAIALNSGEPPLGKVGKENEGGV